MEGLTWTPQASGVGDTLRAVEFIDASSGWAVGDSGVVLSTSDGGNVWRAGRAGDDALFDVGFVDEVGWAVGAHGTIFTTTDGGGIWSASPSGTPQHLYDLDSVDRDLVWAVGANGTVLHTTDGGQSWARQVSGTRERLLSVGFAGAKRGWAVGGGGTVIRTERGGKPWRAEEVGTRHDLYKIHVVDETTAFAVGDLGLLLGYTGRPDVPIGVNLWVTGLILLTAFASVYLWRRYLARPFERRPAAATPGGWRSGWATAANGDEGAR